MNRKSELLSIGEMAKFTGVGIQALRYYERKNILKPAYTDPDSGYRYYSLEQANSVDVISACVELNIPLKELTDLFDTDDHALLEEFFVRNRKAAEKKLKSVNTMMALADKALKRMEINKLYEIERVYKMEFPEKFYYIKSCGQSIKNFNRMKFLVEFAEEVKANLMQYIDQVDSESFVLMEYGFLCKLSPVGTEYFTFAEIPRSLADENTLIIPHGTYFFRKNKIGKIQNAEVSARAQKQPFCEHFMLIEVEEVMSGKTKINVPIYDLRLVCSRCRKCRLFDIFNNCAAG